MPLNLADFTFVPDDSSQEALDRGDGDVLIPFTVLPDPPETLEVVDRQGRSVVFERTSQVFFTNSEAGTRQVVGYSYWESEATEVPCVTPYLNVLVLDATYDAADYPGRRLP